MNAPIELFREAIRITGLTPPDGIEPDGRLHRFHVEGDRRGSRNGWYVLHLDGRAAGAFGSWKTGQRTTWAVDGKPMSQAERKSFASLIKAARQKAHGERLAEHAMRATEARAEWDVTAPADPAHPYLIAKAVKPHSLRQIGAVLIVPLFDLHGQLWNVQHICADGSKRFRPGRAGGLCCPIGDLVAPTTLLICEGWATGATLHEESGHPVLCAMNAGNLLSVSKSARQRWPVSNLVICADNDRYTSGNPGVTMATEAAIASSARLIVPQFPEGELGTDFNDLSAIHRKGGRHE